MVDSSSVSQDSLPVDADSANDNGTVQSCHGLEAPPLDVTHLDGEGPEPLQWYHNGSGWSLSVSSPQQVAQVLNLAQVEGETIAGDSVTQAHIPSVIVLNPKAMNRVTAYEPADLVISIETGATLAQVGAVTGDAHQQLPWVFPQSWILWGVLAKDLPALNTGLTARYPRDRVLGMEVATVDGQLTRCGGRVMKNVTGYDLSRLYVGSHHTLTCVTEVHLSLSPRPEATWHGMYGFEVVETALEEAEALLDEFPGSLHILEILESSRIPQGGAAEALTQPVVLWVSLQGYSESVDRDRQRLLETLGEPTVILETPEEVELWIEAAYQWPADTVVGEWSVPMGEVSQAVQEWKRLESWKKSPITFQIRPAAGLFYWMVDPGGYAASKDGIHQAIGHWQGPDSSPMERVHQWLYWPPGVTAPGGLPLGQLAADARPHNVAMARTLKQQYDPTGTLVHHRFQWLNNTEEVRV